MNKIFCLAMAAWLPLGLAAQTAAPANSASPRSDAALREALNAATQAHEAEAAAQHRSAASESPLVPGPATISGNNVNIRGRASLVGEVVTRLSKGDAVTVLEIVTLTKPRKDEPARWARIAYPTNVQVWVHASFVDPVTKTVIPRTLNLRAGPGENYSVVGTLDQGTVVNELLRKDRWMQIATPPGAYAFVAAEFLRQEPMVAPVVSAEPPPAAPEIAVVELPTAPAPAAPAELEPPAAVVEPKPAPVAVVEPAPAAPAKPVQPPPKRIVQREGIVRYTWNIQAPTSYVLVSPDSGETINYLYTTSTNLNLKRYRGLRILVSGEEGLDSRWTNTPIITIQRIHVIE